MRQDVKHVFFDLDHTLWDFETNSRETLDEIYFRFELKSKGISEVLDFIHVYETVNAGLWAQYRENEITKEELRKSRFNLTFLELGIVSKKLAHEISEYYIFNSPRKLNLFDHTYFILDYLKEKYQLHIITNGFEEVQEIKLSRSKLKNYFTQIVTSEQIGFRKPSKFIFEHALKIAGAAPEESVMIGDDLESDVIGAMNCGFKGVFFNPKEVEFTKHPTHQFSEINCLSELQKIL